MFLFGASTSSHQVEGNTYNEWSIWEHENAYRLARQARKKLGRLSSWPWIKQEATDPHNYISDKGVNHYSHYEEDFDIAFSLGHNANRFSIEWSRIEPKEGYFDENEIEHYKKVIKALRDRNLEPFVTLWHWPLPVWLSDQGGWASKRVVSYFERYVEKMMMAFGDSVKFWVTLNEPEIYLFNSYLKGCWPPGKKSLLKTFFAGRNFIKAHKSSYEIIKRINPEAKVSISKHNVFFESAGGLVNWLIASQTRFWWNRFFLNRIKDKIDFIGLNYYFHNRINYGFNKNANKRVSDMGWELYPEGIYHVIMELNDYFPGRPIYITENGLADSRDKQRVWFIEEHLSYVKKAVRAGALVRGYFHWSLIDNFEWDKGFWPKFGLIAVDKKTGERRVRKSAYVYKQIINKWNI